MGRKEKVSKLSLEPSSKCVKKSLSMFRKWREPSIENCVFEMFQKLHFEKFQKKKILEETKF